MSFNLRSTIDRLISDYFAFSFSLSSAIVGIAVLFFIFFVPVYLIGISMSRIQLMMTWMVGALLNIGLVCAVYRRKGLLETILHTPRGRLLDAFLPPEEAEHRFLEMDEAFDRWRAKYSFRSAKMLYIWQSIVSICLFWFDRVLIRVLARK